MLAALDFIEKHNAVVSQPLPLEVSDLLGPAAVHNSVHNSQKTILENEQRISSGSPQKKFKHEDLGAAGSDSAIAACRCVTATVFCRVCSIDYPRDSDGQLRGMIHPQLQNMDFTALEDGSPLFMGLDGCTVRDGAENVTGICNA